MARVTIVGLGIIGASVGLALKRARLQGVEIVGHDPSFDAASAARRVGAVDKIDGNLVRAVDAADLVVLATPVLAMRLVLEEMASHLTPGCVVTDTGSTKQQIVSWAARILPEGVAFVGGHPMTGKDTAGVDGPDARLFDGCVYCLTPTESTGEEAVHAAAAFVRTLGGSPFFVDPAEHDALVAPVSHLPLVISMALMSLAGCSSGWDDMAKLAAGGFRHAVANAACGPEMSRDLCTTNATNLNSWIDRFIAELRGYQRAITAGDDEALRLFRSAFDAHQKYLSRAARPEADPVQMPSLGQTFQQLFVGRRLSRPRDKSGPAER